MAELNPTQSMDWVRSNKFDECDRNTVRLDSIDHAGMRVLLNKITQQRITSNGKMSRIEYNPVFIIDI